MMFETLLFLSVIPAAIGVGIFLRSIAEKQPPICSLPFGESVFAIWLVLFVACLLCTPQPKTGWEYFNLLFPWIVYPMLIVSSIDWLIDALKALWPKCPKLTLQGKAGLLILAYTAVLLKQFYPSV